MTKELPPRSPSFRTTSGEHPTFDRIELDRIVAHDHSKVATHEFIQLQSNDMCEREVVEFLKMNIGQEAFPRIVASFSCKVDNEFRL
ncbi:hypothetical protein BLNAU_14688 [Blattamonas nauphoetae]|uniref:Uncharacterized protein n=1 Tax=Blattamonas nauphoetae TaxID=2049346 RepID=A0ABQ9XCX1_9EUKA|nr:hypothetical protein BLNAU_14688 [Blattamonas nauphoetae]